MEHHCHAEGCSVDVPPERLMCHRHWRMVPVAVRRAVWSAYRHGQCDDKRPSAEWFTAADAAIASVAQKEGRSLSKKQRIALKRFGLWKGQCSWGWK